MEDELVTTVVPAESSAGVTADVLDAASSVGVEDVGASDLSGGKSDFKDACKACYEEKEKTDTCDCDDVCFHMLI